MLVCQPFNGKLYRATRPGTPLVARPVHTCCRKGQRAKHHQSSEEVHDTHQHDCCQTEYDEATQDHRPNYIIEESHLHQHMT